MTDREDTRASVPDGVPWWRDAVTYEVYLRSSCDGTATGSETSPGCSSKLGHLATLGVDGLWITPW